MRASNRRLAAAALAAAAAVTLAACSSGSGAAKGAGTTTGSAGSPVFGGTAHIAIVSDPPSLDWTDSTSTITRTVAANIFEQLFTLDKNYAIRPMLATGYQVSKDGLTYTIPLRTGVSFQNGQPMTATDVIASLKRWGSISSVGLEAYPQIKAITAPDSHTVTITLKKPYASLIPDLASPVQAAVIIPASIATAAGTHPLTNAQTIGTGPYKLVEWIHNQVVELTAWKGYSPLPKADDWGGFAGYKVAYLKNLDFDVTPSTDVELSGLQTGEFQVATNLSSDSYSQMTQDSAITPVPVQPANALYLVFNKKEQPFKNQLMREAINLVANKSQLAAAGFGNSKFWSLDDAMFFPQQSGLGLYTTAGSADYTAYNPAKAKALMKQAGYNFSRPIRILVTKAYPYMYNSGVALAQELNNIGVKTDVLVYDWPTDLAQRKNPASWDIFITGFAAEADDPTQLLWITPTYNGWYDSPQMQADLATYEQATTPAGRQAAMNAIQQTEWTQLPAVKVANQTLLEGTSAKLHGFQPYFSQVMWNTWLSQ